MSAARLHASAARTMASLAGWLACLAGEPGNAFHALGKGTAGWLRARDERETAGRQLTGELPPARACRGGAAMAHQAMLNVVCGREMRLAPGMAAGPAAARLAMIAGWDGRW